MDLSEIETNADELAGRLYATESKNEALLLGIQIEGLKDLATIKALRDSRAEHNVHADLRQRELAAMETVAEKMPTQYLMPELPQCGHRWRWHEKENDLLSPPHFEICTLSPDHAGSHRNAVTGVSSVATEPTGSTGPLSEVRALIAMWNGYSRNQDERAQSDALSPDEQQYALGQSVAWGKAASILQEVMQKEGLL